VFLPFSLGSRAGGKAEGLADLFNFKKCLVFVLLDALSRNAEEGGDFLHCGRVAVIGDIERTGLGHEGDHLGDAGGFFLDGGAPTTTKMAEMGSGADIEAAASQGIAVAQLAILGDIQEEMIATRDPGAGTGLLCAIGACLGAGRRIILAIVEVVGQDGERFHVRPRCS